jgi:hypothetical protein
MRISQVGYLCANAAEQLIRAVRRPPRLSSVEYSSPLRSGVGNQTTCALDYQWETVIRSLDRGGYVESELKPSTDMGPAGGNDRWGESSG